MEFTYGAYRDLLALLDRQGYQVATYHDGRRIHAA